MTRVIFSLLALTAIYAACNSHEIADDFPYWTCERRSEEWSQLPSHVPVISDLGEEHSSCAAPIVGNATFYKLDDNGVREGPLQTDIVPPYTMIELVCRDGFTLHNSDTTATCLESGFWSHRFGQCIEDPKFGGSGCEAPPIGSGDGEWVETANWTPVKPGSEVKIGNGLQLECDMGTSVPTSSVMTALCSKGGVWNVKLAECVPKKPVDCNGAPLIENGVAVDIYETKSQLGAEWTFTCSEGYILSGVADAKCERNASTGYPYWKIYGTCDKMCPKPTAPNGSIRPVGRADEGYPYHIGMVLDIMCVRGSRKESPATVTCTPDGTWLQQGGCYKKAFAGHDADYEE